MKDSKTAVVADFDGTLTTFDIGDCVSLHFGMATPAQVRASYAEGASVSEWMSGMFGKTSAPAPGAMASFVRSRAVARPGLLELARHCRAKSIPFEIASGGLDAYIEPLLAKWGLSWVGLKCGKARWRKSGGYALRYPFGNGTLLDDYKKERVSRLKKRGYKVIFCGDGTSDFKAAAEADYVFARYKLFHYCRKHGVPARQLRGFGAVLKLLKSGVKAAVEA
ncbi:MAG: HAD-IB family phosphatase [Elusimicrobia bacterium]|nr:HAD-IB family phosphatase [Elusimicrobiota bacterium]